MSCKAAACSGGAGGFVFDAFITGTDRVHVQLRLTGDSTPQRRHYRLAVHALRRDNRAQYGMESNSTEDNWS